MTPLSLLCSSIGLRCVSHFVHLACVSLLYMLTDNPHVPAAFVTDSVGTHVLAPVLHVEITGTVPIQCKIVHCVFLVLMVCVCSFGVFDKVVPPKVMQLILTNETCIAFVNCYY